AGPALSLWRTNLHDALKDGSRTSAGVSGLRTRRLLVALELSLAVLLLTGAGLMLKSFARMSERPAGFVPESIITMKVRFAGPNYRTKEAQQAYYTELLRRVERAPDVLSAGISTRVRLRTPAFPADAVRDGTHIVWVN